MTVLETGEARGIFQEFLDATGHALMTGDAPMFFSRLSFPYVFAAENSEETAQSADEMIARFKAFHNALRGNQVTDFLRVLRGLRIKSETELCGDWETNILRNGHRLIPPYPSRARMVLDGDGNWRCTHGVHGASFPLRFDRFPEVADQPHLRDIFVMD